MQGLIPGWGSKIPHAAQHEQINNNNNRDIADKGLGCLNLLDSTLSPCRNLEMGGTISTPKLLLE